MRQVRRLANVRPSKNANLQSHCPLCGLMRPPKMPLMPEIRPREAISSTAANPISTPPIAAAMGVNGVISVNVIQSAIVEYPY